MKKEAVFVLGLFFIIIASGFVLAEENSSLENMTENQRVNLAYSCLLDEIEETNCSRLSLEEQIFSLLSVGECYDEVMDASRLNECWPKEGCTLRMTSLAVLALDNYGEDTDNATDWILSNNATPKDLEWYLEIESKEATTCKINYSNQEYSINIGENKRINTNAGSCLTLSQGGYWLRINPDCYNQEFQISCDKDFLSTLLFKNPDSSTIYVVDETHKSSSNGTTSEEIKSSCFSLTGECDYESSLWATMILRILREDVSEFVPYLITNEKDNPQAFPGLFLYSITGYPEYKLDVLSKQKNEAYWDFVEGRYYSSALALYPFQGMSLVEKDKTIEWLFETQEEDGCWDNKNIRNNAFLLHSIWPKKVGSDPRVDTNMSYDDDDPCEEKGYTCTNYYSCSTENILTHECSGSLICCASNEGNQRDTCSSLKGEVCDKATQECAGTGAYTSESYSDLNSGEVCCISGFCRDKSSSGNDPVGGESACEREGGTCESGSICGEGYRKTVIHDCSFSSEICCVPEGGSEIPSEPEEKKSYWWLWVLFALIVLATLGILFKDEVREFILKIKTRGGNKEGSPGRGNIPPRGPPGYPRRPMPRPMPPKKIMPRPIPSSQNQNIPGKPRAPTNKPLPNSRNKELDDVLKKLKEMGE